ncbi:hypothetical protein BN2475_230040 [Paraburkholderia ribeironis]|uniref:Uncharacterized protein n=1 Tax=Paraburkholderia ribeironis TaxID=1247936 RepID=A0A1N7RXN3_9BURK|nr:hypothetical protein BN2475_230040 [Paraburkholderia ribeironis]
MVDRCAPGCAQPAWLDLHPSGVEQFHEERRELAQTNKRPMKTGTAVSHMGQYSAVSLPTNAAELDDP